VLDDDWITEGIMFTFPVGQAVLIVDEDRGLQTTGKILGAATTDNALYIVLLDRPFPEVKAVLVNADNLRLLTCHWCRDTQLVTVTPFTGEQRDSNTIPTKPCPYCTEKEVVNG